MTLFLLIVVMIATIVAGCAALNPRLGSPPKLGEYTYIHAVPYMGPPVREIPIWLDKNFGEADKVEMDRAVDAWNFAMNGYIKLKIVDTKFDMEIDKIVQQVNKGGWLFMKIESTNKMVPDHHDKKKGYWTIGFVEQIGGHHLYLVRDRLANEDIYGVTLHEIGHLMGSGHVGQRLMYPHYSRARFQCIDYETMVKVSSFFDLKIEAMNYCVDGLPPRVEEVQPDGGPIMSTCPMGD
jgi:hypothetical protein